MFPPLDCKNTRIQKKQIDNLKQKIPKLSEAFDLHGVIGEGSYGSVFLATLKGETPTEDEDPKLFAIKHLIPVSHPDRIEHELRCLRVIGGKDNVVGVNLCIRRNDAVVFIMPYLPHIKFSEYYLQMDGEEIKFYIKNLLIALKRVHQFNVIHRDVKPSNFLYDRINRKYLLVDFGLAQRVYFGPAQIKANVVNNDVCSVPNQNLDNDKIVNGKKRKHNELEQNDVGNSSKIRKLNNTIVRPGNNPTFGIHQAKNMNFIGKQNNKVNPIPKNFNSKANAVKRVFMEKTCHCAGVPSVCNICLNKQPYKASRSGTPGFRPPEVLLKYPDQTTAVDMWACGVILLSLLSGCYPFFNASDDLTALAEIVTLFGSSNVTRVAKILGRNFLCSYKKGPVSLRKLCTYLRSRNHMISSQLNQLNTINYGKMCTFPFDNQLGIISQNNQGCEYKFPTMEEYFTPEKNNIFGYHKMEICDQCALYSHECICLNTPDSFEIKAEKKEWAGFPDEAFDLLDKLLDLNPHTRIRAAEALNHPFFAEL